MTTDATGHARNVLEGLFRGIGQHAQGQQAQAPAGLNAEWFLAQAVEFVEMPADLARIFTDMAFDLTELVMKALAEAGVSLVTGLTPM